MIRPFILGCLFFFAATAPVSGQAGDGATDLRHFLDHATALRAVFRQSLYTADSDEAQVSEGVLMIKRPGRFRWEYTVPEGQVVVCDGDRVWMYDQDLEQVTVRPIDDTLRGTPAMLLSGQATLDETFEIVGDYEQEGLAWVELRPLAGSPEFESLRIGFAGGSLSRMELKDSLGQMTRIEFFDLEMDADLDDALFVFIPPEGADVIGQGGEL